MFCFHYRHILPPKCLYFCFVYFPLVFSSQAFLLNSCQEGRRFDPKLWWIGSFCMGALSRCLYPKQLTLVTMYSQCIAIWVKCSKVRQQQSSSTELVQPGRWFKWMDWLIGWMDDLSIDSALC